MSSEYVLSSAMEKRRVALIRHTLPIVVFFLIVPQAFISALLFDDYIAMRVFNSAIIVIFSYYFFFFISRCIFKNFAINPMRSGYITPASIVSFFLIVVLVLALTAPEVALFSSLKGAGGQELFDARAAFTKGRSGMELVLVYAYAMVLKGALPISLILLFGVKDRRRWIFMGLILFALLLSLEKFLTAMILVPIGIYFYLIDRKKLLLVFVFLGLGFLTLSSILSGAGSIVEGRSINSLPVKQYAIYHPSVADQFVRLNDNNRLLLSNGFSGGLLKTNLSSQDDYRFALGAAGFLYFFNRSVWIPFITAYDALKYWDEYHDSRLLWGATSAPLAFIFSLPYVNVEQQVFVYQFGGGEDSAGRSNTAFFIDSLINFGWFGVVISSAFCGILFGWFSRCTHPAFAASTVVTAYSLANNSLMPMIWSGGILVLILLALIWRSTDNDVSK